MRLRPNSLFGQTLLILLGGLIVSHAVGSWIYATDRERTVRAIGGLAAAQRIANLTRLIQETPPERRARVAAAVSDETFRVMLAAGPPALPRNGDEAVVARAIADFLVEALSLGPARRPRVWAAAVPPQGPPFGPGHFMGRGHMMHGFGFGGLGGFRDLEVALPLPDGQWVAFATALPDSGPSFSQQFVVSMGLMALIILAASVWAVRRVTAPLAALSAAAERLGNDLAAPPLAETGTIETRRAAHAFNDMQARLRAMIENRTRLLAAISHDLRTPLTLLRLRAENVEDAGERERMLATIAEMDALIGTTLQFARDETALQPRRATDIAALVQSVVDDLADAGMKVTIAPAAPAPAAAAPAAPIVHPCRPDALKRALRNLIDNAVKYGKSAAVAVRATPHAIEITVDDEGPGLPEPELARVFEPFYRVEESRSRDTGGVGLGLAIARAIVQADGGTLLLANRPTGGLRATILLPRSPLVGSSLRRRRRETQHLQFLSLLDLARTTSA
jgi:signal transduction histidine kinase